MEKSSDKKSTSFLRRIFYKIRPKFSFHYVAYTILFFLVVFSIVQLVQATTPNPGHPWSEVGDGVFAVAGPTSTLRTYTFPDSNATVLTTNAAVTVAQGGTGLTAIADKSLIVTTGANTLGTLVVGAGQSIRRNATDTAFEAYTPGSGGTGTVTSVSVTTANGVSGSVANNTTTPAISLTLGNITPTTVNGLTLATQATGFTVAGGTTSKTLTVNNTIAISGTDTSTLNIGTGGTLGSNAFTSTAYLPTASFTDAGVTGKLLTGFSSAAGTVAAGDTILQALNKLDGNISGKQATLVSGTNIKTINGSSILGSGDLTISGGGSMAIGGSITSATQGSILFAGASGVLAQNNTGLNWNDSSALLTLGGDVVLNTQKDLRFADSDSSNWVAFQAPAAVTTNVTWTLPSADASGCLKSNGAGTLSFTGSCGETDREVFAANGTYTKKSDALLVVVEAWGPGGGGGGGGASAAGTAASGGAGGGGGSYVSRSITAASVGATETVTVPAGGAGGAALAAGSAGSAATADTTFGTLVTAYRGGGGAKGNASATAGGGGGGGGSTAAGTTSTTATGGAGGAPGGGAASAAATGSGGGGGGTAAAGGAATFGGGGGSGSTTLVAGKAGGISIYGGGGGGSGASLATTHASLAGGAGGGSFALNGGTAGTAAGAGGTGGDGTISGNSRYGGAGGGGGGSNATLAGANGGNGGAPGGGGGGGGAGGIATVAGGAGGTGGRGEVRVWTYRGTGSDLAEIYGTNDESIEAGDVVALDYEMQAGVKKTSVSYDSNAIGIVSTKPGLLIGNIEDIGAKPVTVALSGRVPVKVNLENGQIKKGDYLTPSSTPGIAMRATKAGTIIGQAMTEYTDENTPGYVVAFIKSGPSNGIKLKQIIPGLTLENTPDVEEDDSGDVETDTEEELNSDDNIEIAEKETIQKTALKYFLANKLELEKATDISEIYTDRLSAALEIITPTVITDIVSANSIVVSTGEIISFDSGVEFSVPPLFNKDTAGFALIKEGDRRVSVVFDEPYISEPIVSADLAFNVLDGITDMFADNIFGEDIKSIIIDSDQNGFTILINKNAPRDLRFSWTAFSVKDPNIFESVVEGLVFDEPNIENNSTNSNSNTSTSDSNGTSESETNGTDVILNSESNDDPILVDDSLENGDSSDSTDISIDAILPSESSNIDNTNDSVTPENTGDSETEQSSSTSTTGLVF